MRLRTFTAASMAKAIAAVRAELGEDAIIVSTEAARNGRGARVVVAVDEADIDADALGSWQDDAEAEWPAVPAPAPSTVPPSPQRETPAAADPILRALAFHGVPGPLADRLSRAAAAMQADDAVQALAAALDGSLAFQPFADRPAPRPVMLVGPPGVGKTLTAARLIVDAHRRGRAVAALSCDTRRAGGCEQLDAFMRILGIPLMMADAPQALADAARSEAAALVIDSAGTNPYDAAEMRELGRLVAAAGAEPVLVLAAGTDAGEAGETAAAFAQLGCRRLVVTRLDVCRRFGGLLAAADSGRLAFAAAGISPHAAEAPSPLTPTSLARLLLSTTPRSPAA
jgi:flagellar biosynthesis protein FlhF